MNFLSNLLHPLPICWSGLDVQARFDIVSFVSITAKRSSLLVDCHFWVAEDEFQNSERFIGMPIRNNLELVPGGNVNFSDIAEWIIKEKKVRKFETVGIDRWSAPIIRCHLGNMGIGFGQGFASMTPPIKAFMSLREKASLRYDDPILDWMIENVVCRTDEAGNIKPDQLNSKGSISGVMALLMAIGLWISPTQAYSWNAGT